MTLRELVWMAEERNKVENFRTAWIVATLVNLHTRTKESDHVWTPQELLEARKPESKPPKVPISILKAVFVDQGHARGEHHARAKRQH